MKLLIDRDSRGGDRMVVRFVTVYATSVVSLNPAQNEVYSIKPYVSQFVSNLQQIGGFLHIVWFPQPIRHHHDIAEILLKVALNTITLTFN